MIVTRLSAKLGPRVRRADSQLHYPELQMCRSSPYRQGESSFTVRILMALPYGPGPTRVRSRKLLEQLAGRHDVTLVTLCWGDDDQQAAREFTAQGVKVVLVRHDWTERARALPGAAGRPLQQIISTSTVFTATARNLLSSAARSGVGFDVVHVEHLRGAVALGLPRPLGARTVFDAVDCLAELARLTSRHNPNPVVRAIARYEQQRTARLEAQLVATVDVTAVAADRDRRALLQGNAPARIVTIPNGVTLPAHPAELTAEPHVIFTGKLSYHANAAAARCLLEDVWPRVRAQVPDARLTLAGADPPGWLRRAAQNPGIELVANPDDLAALVQTARVAAAPIVYSVGIQNKVLEAMAAGVPVVGTASAAAGLAQAGRAAMRIADSPAAFADCIVELLVRPGAAPALGRQGRRYVMEQHTWRGAARRFEALYCATGLRAEAA